MADRKETVPAQFRNPEPELGAVSTDIRAALIGDELNRIRLQSAVDRLAEAALRCSDECPDENAAGKQSDEPGEAISE